MKKQFSKMVETTKNFMADHKEEIITITGLTAIVATSIIVGRYMERLNILYALIEGIGENTKN